jgi:DNA modification methylase
MADGIIQANALHIPLKNSSVHCVITSPPYWGLRDYGVDGQLGLEKTPEEYLEKMVQVFREVWRVLRDDGVCFVNIGDSYFGGGRGGGGSFFTERPGWNEVPHGRSYDTSGIVPQDCPLHDSIWNHPFKLKAKDLVGIPWMLAFALRADGWYLRSDIIWSKPNPMPESVTDRPTKAHEYLFLLTKSPKYFFDQEAVRLRTGNESTWEDYEKADGHYSPSGNLEKGVRVGFGSKRDSLTHPNGRNLRSVWTIATQPFPKAHFATFPEKLVEPCIKAGTSEKGCCPKCGASRVRIVKKKGQTKREEVYKRGESEYFKANMNPLNYKGSHDLPEREIKTLGWRPSCKCFGENWNIPDSKPCVVLDPFFGAGTVGVVAQRLNRRFVGLDLKWEYCLMAKHRIFAETPAMI